MTQARQLWLASRLLRSSYAAPGMREAADAGFRFLRDRMWDGEHGGFYWAVDPSGTKVLQPTKHLYGQAFGLYALSEYAMASGSSEALALAHRLFDLLETRAHDSDLRRLSRVLRPRLDDAGRRPSTRRSARRPT